MKNEYLKVRDAIGAKVVIAGALPRNWMNSVTRTFEIERITSDRFHLKIVLTRCLVCGEAGAQNWIEDVVVRTALWTFSSFTGRFVLFESLREKSSLDKKKMV